MSSCDMRRSYHRPLIPALWADGGLLSLSMNHGYQINSTGLASGEEVPVGCFGLCRRFLDGNARLSCGVQEGDDPATNCSMTCG